MVELDIEYLELEAEYRNENSAYINAIFIFVVISLGVYYNLQTAMTVSSGFGLQTLALLIGAATAFLALGGILFTYYKVYQVTKN